MNKNEPTIDLEDRATTEASEGEDTKANGLHIFSWILPRTLAVIFFVVLFVWIFQAEGGLGFNESNLFGWHALLMALFIVFFTQEAVLSFATPLISGPFRKKCSQSAKWYFHIIYHVLGIISAMLGIVAIVYYKNLSPQPLVFPFYSVYSPHSWLGIAVLVLWGIQGAAGIYVFIIGGLSKGNKIILSKIHRYLGKVIYVAGLATCALGLQDMQSSDLASSSPPMPGMYDNMAMGQMYMTSGNTTMNMTGYYPDSPEAQYSCACTILLLFLGMATFGTLGF